MQQKTMKRITEGNMKDRGTKSVADPVGFDEVRSNPPFLVRWRPFTTSLAVLAEHRPDIYSLFILSVSPPISISVSGPVRFCGELLFFFFLIFFLFPLPILVLGWVQFLEEPTFYLSLFFFSSLLFSLFYSSFFPSFFVVL